MVLQASNFLRKKRLYIASLFIVALYVVLMLALPLPEMKVKLSLQSGPVDTGSAISIEWPDTVQAAVGAEDMGVLASQGADTPVPIASVAKVVTALAVLRQKPLETSQSGPILTMTQQDVELYSSYAASGESVVVVAAGQRITQYQALQMLLMPSGNNMATTLSRWAFGSDAEYTAYANQMLKDMGLTKTHIEDASGFSSQTVSTSSELVRLGLETLKHPVLAQIVSQKNADIPGTGIITNTNKTLGVSYIDGIKTGTTLEAGGCLLFSATNVVGEQKVKVVGVVLGANNREAALAAAPGLVDATYARLSQVVPIKAGQTIAQIQPAWSEAVQAKAQHDLKQIVWQGSPLSMQLNVKPQKSGKVGEATLGTTKSDIVLESDIPEASFFWRLTHPGEIFQAAFNQ